MSYEPVNRLSSRTINGEIKSFYVINEEEYDSFQLPFANLKNGDKVSIRGCKKIWEIRSVHDQSVFQYKGVVRVLGTVTISDERGFYASIHRTDIERVLKTEEDEKLFLSAGQLSLF